ncbi:DNA-3-methyladenine glycosylase I [Terricaulis silvestris]|nr:DNA-3-methyladenine glycosylase I [Terricaulis silvestris]
MTRELPDKPRCIWPGSDPLYLAYHDKEWGVPLRDSRALFEMLQLEGAQAGLSWITILRKRENYRRAFDGFDPVKIARYTPAKVAKLMADEGIVRNRLKIEGVAASAKAYLALEKEGVSFSDFLWNFVGGEPIVNHLKPGGPIPAETETSQAMSKALKQRGFKFVGPTIVYAFMQATGMVNDHLVSCYRHPDFKKRAKR